jgi:hypothetical protein
VVRLPAPWPGGVPGGPVHADFERALADARRSGDRLGPWLPPRDAGRVIVHPVKRH